MLVELSIENYAVIEKLRVRFHRGLNLLSGETGSGKSIVVDALGLLLGARTSAEMVRSGTERARVSGIFEIAGPARRCCKTPESKWTTTRFWSSAKSCRTASPEPSSPTARSPPHC